MSAVTQHISRKYQNRQWARVLFLAEPMFGVARKILSLTSLIAMAMIYAVLGCSLIFLIYYLSGIILYVLVVAIIAPFETMRGFIIFVSLFLVFFGPGILMSICYNNYVKNRKKGELRSHFIELLSIFVSAYYIFMMYILFFGNEIVKEFLRWLD